MATRLLIADDDPNVRLLLRRLLERHGWEICAECEDGSQAVVKTMELLPDAVILDLAMPKMNGLQAAQQILQASPQIAILLLSVQPVFKQLEQAAREIGFRGAVSKGNGREVVGAVEALLRGREFFVVDQLPGASFVHDKH
jgi:DNA-binding NarL/FixJ family response regulator